MYMLLVTYPEVFAEEYIGLHSLQFMWPLQVFAGIVEFTFMVVAYSLEVLCIRIYLYTWISKFTWNLLLYMVMYSDIFNAHFCWCATLWHHQPQTCWCMASILEIIPLFLSQSLPVSLLITVGVQWDLLTKHGQEAFVEKSLQLVDLMKSKRHIDRIHSCWPPFRCFRDMNWHGWWNGTRRCHQRDRGGRRERGKKQVKRSSGCACSIGVLALRGLGVDIHVFLRHSFQSWWLSLLNKDHLVIVIRDILYEVGWWFYLPLLKLFLNTRTFGSHVVPEMGVLHHGLLDVFIKAEAVSS